MKKQIDFVRVHHNKFSNHYWQVTVVRKAAPRTYDPTNASLERINQLQESDNIDFWIRLLPNGKSELEIYP